MEGLGVGDFLEVSGGDVEGVHGDAFFGADAGVSGVEVSLVDGVEEVVEEADAVEGLDFDGGAGGVEVVGDVGADGDGEAGFGAWFEEVGFSFQVVFGFVVLGLEDGGEGVGEAVAGGGVGDGFEVGGADAEDVEDDVVGAGEEVCGEDVDLFGGEGAAEFFEEEGSVAGGEDEFGVAFVGLVCPFDAVGVGGFFLLLGDEEVADGADLGFDFVGVAVGEGGGGCAVEVLFDFLVVVFAHDGDDFGAELFAVFVEFALEFFAAIGEEGEGCGVELEHEGRFPAVPGVGCGAAGVAVGEEEEGVEVFGVFDDGGEFGDDFGVFEVFGGGEAPEDEVVVDEEHDEGASAAFDLEAGAGFGGEDEGAVDVFADVFGASGVVEDEGEVEGVGVNDFVEVFAEVLEAWVGGVDEFVEFIDAAEGVFVGGVAVEEFVLDEAVEGAEFGEVAAEEADAVHLAEGACDLAFAFEDGLEGIAVCLEVAEGFVDVVPVGGDEAAHLWGEAEVAELGVLEEAHEAVGVFLEDVLVGGVDAAAACDEVVEFLAFFSTEGEEGCEAGFGDGFLLDLEGFHDGVGMAVEVAGVAVVVAHEGLGAAEHVFFRVAEGGGDDALEEEGEDVRGFSGVIVEFVADAEEEVVGFFDFAEGVGGDDAFVGEFAEVVGAGFDACDPEDVLVVAEAAAGFFYVGFLEEDGVGGFFVSCGEVLAACFEEGVVAFSEAVFVEGGEEALVEVGVAGDEASFEEGCEGLGVGLSFFYALGDGAAGVADFEAEVPEGVEDVLDEFLDVFGEFSGGAGEEEEDVDVGGGVEGAAAVAAGGDEGDGGFVDVL